MTMLKIEARQLCAAISANLSHFLRDERGATAIEYAMIASGVGVAIAATVTSLGSSVKGLFNNVSTALK
jgi:pilus assembly protein Flp/PilA